VDIGGTFTDVAVLDETDGPVCLGKSATTPQARVRGILTAIREAQVDVRRSSLLIHGSTVVINALIERRGARTALITTKGFRDVYEIGRINRPESFNLFFRKHAPLVPRNLRCEVSERLDATGAVVVPLDEAEATSVAQRLADQGIEAVAVVFLHAYRNAAHERRMREILAKVAPHVFVSLSHEVSNEYREFERTSTAVANAYVGPLVRSYLTDLEREGVLAGMQPEIWLMQSNGGVYDLAAAKDLCIYMLESGPAAGVTGVTVVCRQRAIARAISFDMGGTTAKAAVIEDGVSRMAADYFVGGYNEGLPLRIPVVDIHEVGTGGGSIARVDPSGLLLVGPQSAGAEPGPICYGLGGVEPTVTDANIVLGRIDPTQFLGGRLQLQVEAAADGIRQKIARPLGMTVEEAASGILRVAAAAMANAVRAVTTQRGLDPREFTLIAYGGAGPLHASAVARALCMSRVLIPRMPAHFSAVGMLYADLRRDAAQTFLRRLRPDVLDEMAHLYGELEARGRAGLAACDAEAVEVLVRRTADLRYVGQEHTVTIPVMSGLAEPTLHEIQRAFDAEHELRYGHSAPGEPVELVTLRVAVTGVVAKPPPEILPRGRNEPPEKARRRPREIYFDDLGRRRVEDILWRDSLLAGNVVVGPAAIDEAASVTLVAPGDQVDVLDCGELSMEIDTR
jgi:N-methylhydantoinase A